ncbi:hypothetical protein A2803_03355 [Candidatus Woesebacteria bacterium RIFCSPHIGHO2_01_FULL_44_21]|uniref:UDP-N-acetyl-alpha-D-muramoyl-L-alanyl-L-glutamate epimerase n=1 Tax=Candidatus Woesebacteria bacterium RIFCSPHIGHO2_01_FULL_44_21 TaxID=1802503 RepID=A0A1F7YYX8_9BACT|nr:MAG: hypothetical protein A2803_03355 [Candidatus Woesebacteria bacterium RIFCSPHIGHO2_01_FULL_44_21]OGM69129.1 MAG: hypothetical protein A2897_04885 [Candidatus Woesebacteria bacterium RIFCSPLOWO2_01_FULL_44_24b]
MNFKNLRQRHPKFVYEEFDYRVHKNFLQIKFHFWLAPDTHFSPTLEIPVPDETSDNLDNLVFHLGLIEMISYWKATCSPNIVIKAGKLTGEQIAWWRHLFINGLGEFFYQNEIDFNQENFLTINSEGSEFDISETKKSEGNLILIGGGKDSAVTAELLEGTALLLNPTGAALKVTEISELNSIIIKRTIDPTLLQLNVQGYLNGHTPFSAYLSFLSLLVARLYGFKNIVVSNEASAGEANLEYLGLKVNHQYSKSFEYEKLFREYTKKYLSKKINYFSFLRPLNELQIAALFVQTEKYDKAFNSCNIGRNEYWCGECPKCAFSFLILSSLIDKTRLEKIFGESDFFKNEKIKRHIKDLTGEGKHKPLDCVGTEEESKMALKLIGSPNDQGVIYRIKNDWSDEHFLPEEYSKLLKDKMASLKL